MHYIQKIDRVISNINAQIRILYLESDNPDVLRMVLDKNNGSNYLKRWLGIAKLYNSFEEARRHHAARPLLSIYEQHGSYGILKDEEYYIRQEGLTERVISVKPNANGVFEPVYFCCDNERFCIKVRQHKEKIAPPDAIDLRERLKTKFIRGNHVLYWEVDAVPLGIPTIDSCQFLYLTNAGVLDKNALAQMLQAFLESDQYRKTKLILTGTTRSIPGTMADQIQLIRLGAPSIEDIKEQMKERISDCGVPVKFSEKEIREFSETLAGLTFLQLESIYASFGENLARDLRYEPGKLAEKAWQQKEMESEKDGILVFNKIEENPGVVGIGGFERWLNENLPDLADPASAAQFGNTPPRGLIISGVPGTGKTQLAKQMAYQWNQMVKEHARPVSFIEFNIGSLSSEKYGESEAMMNRFLARISEQAPAVLLVDEVEKTFYRDKKSNQEMHEVKKQMMGMFLFWLQEHKENIFTFMTSNDMSILPPELIRSGRLSERFFVFLPSYIELMSMLYSFLWVKAKKGIYDEAFKREINSICAIIGEHSRGYGKKPERDRELDNELASNIRKGSLSNVLETLTDYAERNKRMSFMTGADMKELVEKTNRSLRTQKPGKRWSGKDFADAMRNCCCRDEFSPYAQSNMNKLVELYLSCDNNDVSSRPLLPRVQFLADEGRFVWEGEYIRGTAPQYDYDRYLQKTVAGKIEEAAAREKREKERLDRQDRLQQEQEAQMGFRSKQMEFQAEQMERQRNQWAEDDEDRPGRKKHEENARRITELQLRKLEEE